MKDLPAVLLTGTIWAYWSCVGIMIVRVRRKTRKQPGVVPRQRLEQWMWLVWVPLVAAWATLPSRLPGCLGRQSRRLQRHAALLTSNSQFPTPMALGRALQAFLGVGRWRLGVDAK